MNPQTYAEAEKLFKSVLKKVKNVRGVEVVICPPFVWLTDISHKYRKEIGFGAQDVFWEERGAYTGEISPKMLLSSGVKYVIIGHSERRATGETDEVINKKVKTALRSGLKIILCVGEPLSVRKKGLAAAKKFVKNQLREDLKGIGNKELGIKNLVVAYEPVWAISSRSGGKSDTPEDAVEMACFIKEVLDSLFMIRDYRVLYGGSVNAKNAKDFLSPEEIDGALVGKASLNASEFAKIVRTALN